MKNDNQFLLLATRRFSPLFLTQFLGAFHDNLFKNAFVVMLLFDAGTAHVQNPKLMTTMAAGIFILPFVIFSALGGQMADKFSKDKVIRTVKLVEIFIALLGTISLFSGSISLSFVTLFALGTHSAFFSPSKYSILPQHLETHELIGGNALVNTGTFLAILCGTIFGTALITLPGGKLIVSGLLIGSALCGYFSARHIPAAPPKAQDLRLNYNPLSETCIILRQTLSQAPRVVRYIWGISWFWFLGATFMAQLPNFTKEALGANEHVLSFFLVLFSLGIAAGGLLNNSLLKGKMNGAYVPLAILGITLFSADLYFASGHTPAQNHLLRFAEFITIPHNWRIIFDFLMIALCGGLFAVPLNAIVQHSIPEDHSARILAGSAILNALLMVASSVISALLIGTGFSIRQIFMIFAAANAVIAFYMWNKNDL